MNQDQHQNPVQPAVSAWGALARVIFEPGATFAALAQKMPVLPGYLLQMVVTLGASAVTIPKSLAFTAELLAKQNAPANAVAITKVISVVTGVVAGVAMPWIIRAILALVAAFFGQFQGGSVGFSKYFGMIGYARVPLAIAGLVQVPLIMRATTIAQMSTMSISLAALLPAGANPVVRAFLTTLNPFDIWYYLLLAIGFGALHRVKPAKSLGFVLTIYVLVLLMTLVGGAATAKVPGM